jgi:N-acetylneuraminate synthase
LFKIKKFADEIKIDFFATIGDLASLELVKKLFIKKIKISSGLITNIPLIEEISKNKLELIISTGMAFKKEIMEAINVASKYLPKNKISLLKCTSLYPAPDHLLNLAQILLMKKKFSIKIGYSDHSLDDLPVIVAVSLGAEIIEKHFTDNLMREGPDISASMDMYQCKELIVASKILYKERGGKKNKIPEEKVTSDFAFATVVSIKKIIKGEVLSMKNIWVKRPGTGGIKASDFKSLLGRKVNKDIDTDTHLSFSDLNN